MFVNPNTHLLRIFLSYGAGLIVLLAMSFGLSYTSLTIIQSFRVVLGSVFLFLLPGYAWSFVFWKGKAIDIIARFALSLTLSLALVPLIVYALNRIGVRITLWNSIVEISGLILVGVVTRWTLHHIAKRKAVLPA